MESLSSFLELLLVHIANVTSVNDAGDPITESYKDDSTLIDNLEVQSADCM